MKNPYTLFLLLSSLLTLAQVPQKINYQGIARHSDGTPITTNISLKFEILSSPSATVAFTETHASVAVSALGLFSEQIGSSTALPTTWTNTPYSLRVSIDSTGTNSSYQLLGSQELVSVPFALRSAPPSVTLDPNTSILSVGGNTVQLPTPAGLQNLISLPNGSIAISNGNTVTIALPTLTPAGGGITSIVQNGYGYTLNSPSVSIGPLLNPGNTNEIIGLAQVRGSFPNYSVIVAPSFVYSQATGSLVISNRTDLFPLIPLTPTYSYSYNITPALTLTNNNTAIQSGPVTNQIDITNITPWRHAASTPVVTLATSSDKVGIGLTIPTSELHVDGYTKLGAGAPAMQVAKINTVTPNSVGGTISIPLPQVTYLGASMGQLSASKILSISMMADPSNGSNSWISSGNATLANSHFYWQVVGSNIIVTNAVANSSNIVNVPLRIMITFEQ